MANTGAFVALIHDGIATQDCLARFFVHVGCEPRLVLTTQSRSVLLAWSGGTNLARSEDDAVAVFVHGDLLPPGPVTAHGLLERYLADGALPATDINGSAAILVVDVRADGILAVTDRLNSRKLFQSAARGDLWISTHHRLQPLREHGPDPIGVAWYVSNGAVYGDRTVFEGIRPLERASVHEVLANEIQSSQCWDHRIEARPKLSQVDLVHGLQERLIEAVRRCIFHQPDIFLSLSGGFDVAGLLGILREHLGVSDIFPFSYARGRPKPGSDEAIAAALAGDLGLGHQIVQSYTGDYPGWLKCNALMGGGFACLCDEVAAWTTIGRQCGAFERPAIFAGDEALGWVDCRLNEPADALACNSIHGSGSAEWFISKLPTATATAMREGTRADIAAMLDNCPSFDDLHDLKDYLYLTRRLSSTILPWRQYFAGSFAPVRSALLDRDVIDFMERVPAPLRRQKRLYRMANEQLAPRVFSTARATGASYHVDHRTELARYRQTLQGQLRGGKSGLDSLIPPESLLALWGQCTKTSNGRSLRQTGVQAAKLTLHRLGLKDALRRFDRRPQCPRTPLATVLSRSLMLRAALADDFRPFFEHVAKPQLEERRVRADIGTKSVREIVLLS